MDERIRNEIRQLADESATDLVEPQVVVDFAKENASSALHDRFDWDDERVANASRCLVAKHLVNAYVRFEERKTREITGSITNSDAKPNPVGITGFVTGGRSARIYQPGIHGRNDPVADDVIAICVRRIEIALRRGDRRECDAALDAAFAEEVISQATAACA